MGLDGRVLMKKWEMRRVICLGEENVRILSVFVLFVIEDWYKSFFVFLNII